MVKSFADLIDTLGRPTVARLLKTTDSHVRAMRTRNSIAPEHWGLLIEACAKQGIQGADWKKFRAWRTRQFGDERASA